MQLQEIMADSSGVLRQIVKNIVPWQTEITSLSQSIFIRPEEAFKENFASFAISSFLTKCGFEVNYGIEQLPTAFTATAGSGKIVLAFLAEYDALPKVGHACGHHLIAGGAVAAALGLLPLVDQLDLTIKIVGTPAEEQGGGKALLLEQGVFSDVHLAIMFHPVQSGISLNPTGHSTQAVGRFRAVYRGRSAHAAAAPHHGINAADASVVAQVAVGLLRQQIPSDHRIALVVKEGGNVTNIIPDTSIVDFECRAFKLSDYEALVVRVRKCFEGAAYATGTEVDIVATQPVYLPVVQDPGLSHYWIKSMKLLGHDVSSEFGLTGGSTDMGNVSQVIPAIHPWVSIPGVHHPIHSEEFAFMANQPVAYEVMFESAVGMAWTAAMMAHDPEEVERLTG